MPASASFPKTLFRRAATLVVLVLGAATTIATSAPAVPTLSEAGSATAHPGEVPHVTVTFDAQTMAAARELSINAYVVDAQTGELLTDVSYIADDPALVVPEPDTPGSLSLGTEDIQPRCSAGADCVIGLNVQASASRDFDVHVTAHAARGESDDAFPSDSTIAVEVE